MPHHSNTKHSTVLRKQDSVVAQARSRIHDASIKHVTLLINELLLFLVQLAIVTLLGLGHFLREETEDMK